MSKELIKARELLAVPDAFVATARAFPEKVAQALTLMETVEEVTELLDKAATLEHYSRRIKVDTRTINCIQNGKLKIVQKLGGLMPRATPQQRGAKGGRGKKATTAPEVAFRPETISTYRKVHDNGQKIDEYFAKLDEAGEQDDPPEASMAGFIRYVSSDGNLKAHQNKGVIEWYTPEKYVAAARRAMGGIDVDPASNHKAQEIVQAKAYYTKEDNGLEYLWEGNVFLNPPFKADLIKAFVEKLVSSYGDGTTKQAVLLTNNNTDTQWWHAAVSVSSAICFTKGRINFYSPAGEIAQPTNGHTLIYMGKRAASFSSAFADFGAILEVSK